VDDDALVLLNTAAMLEDLGHTPCWRRSPARRPRHHPARHHRSRDHRPGHAAHDGLGSRRRSGRKTSSADHPATGFAELPPARTRSLPKLSKPFLQQQLADVIAKTVASCPGGTDCSKCRKLSQRLCEGRVCDEAIPAPAWLRQRWIASLRSHNDVDRVRAT
jgi:hypothetical protein